MKLVIDYLVVIIIWNNKYHGMDQPRKTKSIITYTMYKIQMYCCIIVHSSHVAILGLWSGKTRVPM